MSAGRHFMSASVSLRALLLTGPSRRSGFILRRPFTSSSLRAAAAGGQRLDEILPPLSDFPGRHGNCFCEKITTPKYD